MKNNMISNTSVSNRVEGRIVKTLGICLGASTISVVWLEGDGQHPNHPRIVGHRVHSHEGNPKETLLRTLKGIDLNSFDRIAVTGRRFKRYVNLTSIPEPEAVEYAYRFVKPQDVSCPAVVSAGGETFMVYILNNRGQISNVLTGNKCASGTGEFFLQQLRRMDVTLEEAAQWAASQEPHHVSGRCSVFCKSDCTHATNKGVPRSKVTAGLCKMMAHKILELLKRVEKKNIMITGGTAKNKMMIEYLKQEIPGLIVPQEAPYFEALGAALWALDHDTIPYPDASLLKEEIAAFDTLPPLVHFRDQVEFKSVEMGRVRAGDACILGLDVGSTTTKAVLLRKQDDAILASIYLRTGGDPVGASRKCYRHILEQVKETVDPSEITIEGLGVCGSGRQIAGLHALTDGVINEIIAHATAAVYFDNDVDTIFEIGGQDAKYTYITNGVPSDYAMNEACSAGTGSFLEESALETLGVQMTEIADIALLGEHPPNFNDQCAAFIASDIKNAIHEGVKHEDIIAGLVYSICMNYTNRVKGNRPVGEKVFMQGGVCYNHAVPLAMASLVGKPIIVPPEPGLMGAFGVALEVKKRIDRGLLKKERFDLTTLVNREALYRKPFTCKGGKEKCDRKCEIAVIELEGKRYPFGGACNRYYNLRHNIRYDAEKLDLVRIRQHLVFETYAPEAKRGKPSPRRGRIGFNRSFLVNTYYPLYSNFFTRLGFEPLIPEVSSQEGIDLREAPFCYPVELAHGFFYSLITMQDPPEYIFLPHFKAVPLLDDNLASQVCPLVQGETYYLRTTFKTGLDALKKKGIPLLTPVIDLTGGIETAQGPLIRTAIRMGAKKEEAKAAFAFALARQRDCISEMKRIGREALKTLESDPEKIAVVIFARSYNGFVEEAHMGIPHKIASRGVMVIPMDFLPHETETSKHHMYWGIGQLILKTARFVQKHPQLFGTYITNFSCGPDSFVIGYFREIMGRKPSLTLELDNHTADAGLETRIEAFLDIVSAYRRLMKQQKRLQTPKAFIESRVMISNGIPMVSTSDGKTIPMTDPKVCMLFPSMGNLASESITAIFRGSGYHAKAHPPSDEAVLKIGRANTSCKECLPLILTTGTLLNYIRNEKKDDEILVYFMPTGSGPCRFGQYAVFMEDLIRRLKIPNVAVMSLTSDNSYLGLGNGFQKKGWWSVLISDTMEDIRSVLLANAIHPDKAIQIFGEEWQNILTQMETGEYSRIRDQLKKTALRLSRIPLKEPVDQIPTIALVGEIFVRRDDLSRQFITETLAEKGFATICSPIAEWMRYSDYTVKKGLSNFTLNLKGKIGFLIKEIHMGHYEKDIKSILSQSGLVHAEPLNIDAIIRNAAPFISPDLAGEAILTVGSALTEVVTHACGVISIGPFGCMPNRLSEAILSRAMNRDVKLATDPKNPFLKAVLTEVEDLPFLAIESDGSPFPQLINAKLETFCLRAKRLHGRMMDVKKLA
ncbi:MAG: acyl-CoA dehydratase activase [Pseudomonadota bacterium]